MGNKHRSQDRKTSKKNKDQGKKKVQTSKWSRGKGQYRPQAPRLKFGNDEQDVQYDSFKANQFDPQIKEIADITRKQLETWLQKPDKSEPNANDEDSEMQLDPWQHEALEALLNGESVIVDAPTTAGKTRVVEAFFKLNLTNPNFRAAYTAPVKSLSNDKLAEFSEMFGNENVGIATGDIKENLHAPIVVATLESYRNSLLGVEPDLGRSLAVFDEYHFMQDSGRGSAWEEAIILTPPGCQILMLSASVENPIEFCQWVEKINQRPCRLIQVKHRPVPLEHLVFYKEKWLLADELNRRNMLKSSPQLKRFPLEHNEIARRIRSIVSLGLTPCMVYAGRRLSCESMAQAICKQLDPLPKEKSIEIKEFLDKRSEDENPLNFMKANLRRMILVYGVGYHHSGIAPNGRRAIESLVKEGYLRFCVATMGLSIGINFSVKSALISDYKRPGEQGFVTYPSSEVLQMLGRAGRRGRDLVGFSLWPSVDSYLKFGKSKRDKVQSRLKNDPTTFLGLLGRGFKLHDIESFYQKSFLKFGNKKAKFSLLQARALEKNLKVKSLPCGDSPISAFADYLAEDARSHCLNCQYRKKCHSYINQEFNHQLASLHIHLHWLGCINPQEKLTEFGSVARYFPQAGGLLMAEMLTAGKINEKNLLTGLELMAALSLARFKEPGRAPKYKFPFKASLIEEQLEDYYPLELFEELYDPPNSRRDEYVFKEFNPAAGYAIREWANGCSWTQLKGRVCHEKFAEGDLVALIYRSATYLQSLAQAHIPEVSRTAKLLRNELLRDPLTPTIRTENDKLEADKIESQSDSKEE